MPNELEFKPPPGYTLDPEEPKQQELIPPLFVPPKGYQLDPERGQFPFPQAVKEAAPYVGRAVAHLPTILGGSFGGPIGAALGYGVSSGLRSSNPAVFGKPPEDIADLLIGGAGEAFLQGAVPKVIEGGIKVAGNLPLTVSRPFRSFPAVRSKLAENITEQALKRYRYPESMILESAAENAKANYRPPLAPPEVSTDFPNYKSWSKSFKQGAKKTYGDLQAAYEQELAAHKSNEIGQALLNLQAEYEMGTDATKSLAYEKVSSKALSSVKDVQNFKLATGEPRGIEQLALNKLITNNFKESSGKINASKVLNELGGAKKGIYEEAIGASKLDSLKSLMGELKTLEEGHRVSDGLLRWSQGHLLWTLPLTATALMTGHSTIGRLGLAASGVVVSNKLLARLMSNEATAKLTFAALRTTEKDKEAGFIREAFNSVLESLTSPGGSIAQTARIPIGAASVPQE